MVDEAVETPSEDQWMRWPKEIFTPRVMVLGLDRDAVAAVTDALNVLGLFCGHKLGRSTCAEHGEYLFEEDSDHEPPVVGQGTGFHDSETDSPLPTLLDAMYQGLSVSELKERIYASKSFRTYLEPLTKDGGSEVLSSVAHTLVYKDFDLGFKVLRIYP